jgi:hypothetical protein
MNLERNGAACVLKHPAHRGLVIGSRSALLGIADSQDGLNHEQCVIDDMENSPMGSMKIREGGRRFIGFKNPGFQATIDMRSDGRYVHPIVGRLGCEDTFEDHLSVPLLGGLVSISSEKAFAEEAIEFRNLEDFLGGCIHVVFDSAIFQEGWIEDRIATSPVFVPWLSNASDVDHRFGLGKPVSVVEGVGGEELVIGGENPRGVGMPLEAKGLDHPEEFLHLAAVEDVVGKHVFIDRIADRTVDEQESVLAMNPW